MRIFQPCGDTTSHGELGTIFRIEAQAVGKTRKRETPAAFATRASVVGGGCLIGLRLN